MSDIIVLDIEGTVCPISFVHDTLFPYALKKAEEEIAKVDFPVQPARSELEKRLQEFPEEFKKNATDVINHIKDLTARDVKAPYLKALQGYLWKSGYEGGELKAPVFPDATKAIKKWSSTGKVYIYSSGSVQAQVLFFKYTDHGDLTPYISGYFDTVNAGRKTELESYKRITDAIGQSGKKIRFFSDNPAEIDTADAAGWNTTFTVRPGNPEFNNYKWPGEKTTSF